jgi:hypothetical protein
MPTAKKRKMADENHMFQSKLTKEYFFGYVNDVAICLVCNGKLSCFKEYSIKRHYGTNHILQLGSLRGKLRKYNIYTQKPLTVTSLTAWKTYKLMEHT